MENKHGHIEQNRARIWQIGLFSLNNTSTNLFLAMMGYVSYYANGIAGLSVVLISVILTGMRIFDSLITVRIRDKCLQYEFSLTLC